jgi:hypothetical protein
MFLPPLTSTAEPDQSAMARRWILLPFRSLGALTNPQIAVRRFVRLLVRVARCQQVFCSVAHLNLTLTSRMPSVDPASKTYSIALQYEGIEFGSVDIRASEECWQRSAPSIRHGARLLAEHMAIHTGAGSTVRPLRGVVMSPEFLHTLNNKANTLSMQSQVICALLEQGKPAEAAAFAARSAETCDSLVQLMQTIKTA